MNKYSKEIPLWVLILLPYAYLATLWKKLPDRVPTHFTLEGVPDDWSAKSTLLILPGILGLGIYLLMLFIPRLDPKKKIQEMGDKYYSLRLLLSLFMTFLALFTLHISHTGTLQNPNLMFGLIGALFAVLGNYSQAIRPNYFIGIRTPWTLESENVWKKTHRLGGILWMIGGLLIILNSILLKNPTTMNTIFMVLICIMVVIPIIYSYIVFQRDKNILTP